MLDVVFYALCKVVHRAVLHGLFIYLFIYLGKQCYSQLLYTLPVLLMLLFFVVPECLARYDNTNTSPVR